MIFELIATKSFASDHHPIFTHNLISARLNERLKTMQKKHTSVKTSFPTFDYQKQQRSTKNQLESCRFELTQNVECRAPRRFGRGCGGRLFSRARCLFQLRLRVMSARSALVQDLDRETAGSLMRGASPAATRRATTWTQSLKWSMSANLAVGD